MRTTGTTIPTKTPEGQNELARRERRLGQRYRTVLLLVDGRRTIDQVLALVRAAGVNESHFDELVTMGLLALPAEAGGTTPLDVDLPIGTAAAAELSPATSPLDAADAPRGAGPAAPTAEPATKPLARVAVMRAALPPMSEVPAPPPAAADEPVPTHAAPSEAPAAAAAPATTASAKPAAQKRPAAQRRQRVVTPPPAEVVASVPPADSLLPAVRSLLPDSASGELGPPVLPGAPTHADGPLEEAREILMRALRNEAPVAGHLTLMKVKRAASRTDIEELLEEVEARISKPRKMILAAQTIRHVRHLLGMPTSTSFTML